MVVAGSARAQSDEALQQARAHFEAGRALYRVGNYTDAVREFGAGYALAPQKPQFLLNLGQCYRKLDDLDKAREMYARYLKAAPASDPERAQAQQILSEIEQQIAARPAGESPPPSAPSPPPRVREQPEPVVALVPAATAQPPQRSFIRRNWWIIPVAAVVAGVAIGVGVYYGTRSNVCDGATLGCFPVQ
jgi:tetratricopeptide (TPR) repeat protein